MKRLYLLVSLSVLLAAVLGFQLLGPSGALSGLTAWAQGTPLKIFVNDAPSQLKAIEVDGAEYVPLYFAAEPGKATYQVTVSYDAPSRTMKIEKIKKGKRFRGDHNCERCSGSGKCQACYPVGSGKSIQGEGCPVCNGSGKCTMCNGAGSY